MAVHPTGIPNVPPLPPGVRYVDLAVGALHFVALRSDGDVIAWGDWNNQGQLNVPRLPPGTRYVEIQAGELYTVARRSDGAVVAWGDDRYFQRRVPDFGAGVTVKQLAAGREFTLALLASGGFERFGSGCAGRAGVTGLEMRDPPQVGVSFGVALVPRPTTASFVLVGFSNTQAPFGPPPFDLTGLGMTGCRLRVSADLLLAVDAATGEAKLPLDKDPGLPGVRLHLQAIILEPGANPFGAVLSDAVTAVVGG